MSTITVRLPDDNTGLALLDKLDEHFYADIRIAVNPLLLHSYCTFSY